MSSSLTQMLSRHRDAVADFTDADLPSLRQALSQVADPRDPRGVRYVFTELLLICAAAVIAGASTLLAMTEWAADAYHRGILPRLKAVPSLATIHRLMARTDAVAFDEALALWIRQRVRSTATRTGKLTAIAIDGKEVRGAKNAGGTRTFLMAALDHCTGTVVGQEAVGEKPMRSLTCQHCWTNSVP